MQYLSTLVFVVTACVVSSQSLAFGRMSATEVNALFSGNTVEGERRDGGVPGIDAPNKIQEYATEFVVYFDNDGTLKKKTSSMPAVGKWRVTDNGDLCIQWQGKKEKCAPVHKDGKVYKRVIKKGQDLYCLNLDISVSPRVMSMACKLGITVLNSVSC